MSPSSETSASVTERASCVTRDRKSTRLNSSHGSISYAVFRLKKKIRRYVLGESGHPGACGGGGLTHSVHILDVALGLEGRTCPRRRERRHHQVTIAAIADTTT